MDSGHDSMRGSEEEVLNLPSKVDNALGRALDRHELTLHYQPQVDLRTGRVVGLEALLRWKHPVWGMVPPSRFIPLAEASGLIVPIGEWVLRNACSQTLAWRQQGLPPMTVAVNVSAHQFQEGIFCTTVASALAEFGLAPDNLELEITESIAMDTTEHTLATLHGLKTLGVKLAIDDFGTGYSSLARLKCCPVDKLKVDQSFVRNLTSDATDDAIVRAIVFLGHSLGMRVIAEGVETKPQLSRVQAHGCDEAQGYWFGSPVAPRAVPAALQRISSTVLEQLGQALP